MLPPKPKENHQTCGGIFLSVIKGKSSISSPFPYMGIRACPRLVESYEDAESGRYLNLVGYVYTLWHIICPYRASRFWWYPHQGINMMWSIQWPRCFTEWQDHQNFYRVYCDREQGSWQPGSETVIVYCYSPHVMANNFYPLYLWILKIILHINWYSPYQ